MSDVLSVKRDLLKVTRKDVHQNDCRYGCESVQHDNREAHFYNGVDRSVTALLNELNGLLSMKHFIVEAFHKMINKL